MGTRQNFEGGQFKGTPKKPLGSFAPTIYSETVCLRQLSQDDSRDVLNFKCHDEVFRSVAWQSAQIHDEHDFEWAAQEVASGETFGSIKLAKLSPITAEIEFIFHGERWKRRLSYESLRLVLDWAFTRFPQYQRIQARCLPTSTPSGELLGNIGMRLEGVNRAALRIADELLDLSCHAMTREDWAVCQENTWSFKNYDFSHI